MATKKQAAGKKSGGRKNKSMHGVDTAQLHTSIFGEGGSDIIPGELIVQLDDATAASITQSIPRGPMRGRAMAGTTRFGVSALDNALATLKVTSVTRLHPPAPVESMAMAEATVMASTFRVTFDKSTSVNRAMEQVRQVAGVQYVEPNCYRETCAIPNDPDFPSQWGLAKINAPAAWDRTTGSPNIVVAVIDTGVDLDHPELGPLLVPGFDMVDLGANPTPPPGFRFEGDFQGRDNVPQDEVGHGTHVAGTIACLSNNTRSVAGVTWQCRLMPVKVLTRIVNIANPSDVRGTGSAADIAAGIRWAVDHGARVLNLSLGGTTDTQVERDAIAYAIARGAVVCAAMGNRGLGGPTSFPAAYPDVVAVGAIDATDLRANFSQVGPHIDIVGPGVDILSTVWNDSTTRMSGTSMATPHVAGVAALVLSCNSSLTGAQVADILRQTARPLRDVPADPVPNNNYGFGCVDAQAAVNRACPRIIRTLQISCRHTLQISCRRTLQISCRQSRLVLCGPSTVISCPSRTIACDPLPSRLVLCGPSTVIRCPQPSVTLRCPSTLVCGGPIGPGDPGPLEASAGDSECCENMPQSEADWAYYDPYAGWYGDEGAE
ncbi:MAG: hypothetical protein E8D41_09640 [Nitrospira sp.]|nr:MAG: hypothetical protein E8D41_09640 [Nitrospira sp.]